MANINDRQVHCPHAYYVVHIRKTLHPSQHKTEWHYASN